MRNRRGHRTLPPDTREAWELRNLPRPLPAFSGRQQLVIANVRVVVGRDGKPWAVFDCQTRSQTEHGPRMAHLYLKFIRTENSPKDLNRASRLDEFLQLVLWPKKVLPKDFPLGKCIGKNFIGTVRRAVFEANNRLTAFVDRRTLAPSGRNPIQVFVTS